MARKYIKINNPEHEYHSETFLVFFESATEYHLRGHGVKTVILKEQGLLGVEKDYVGMKCNDALEKMLIETGQIVRNEEVAVKEPVQGELFVVEEIAPKKAPENLALFNDMRAQIAKKYSVNLPDKAIVGIAAIYMEWVKSNIVEQESSTVEILSVIINEIHKQMDLL
jgi:hypothetical protein